MRQLLLISLTFWLPLACAGLPEIHAPAGETAPSIRDACERIFPRGRWQLVHSIEAAPPDGSKQTMLGVMQLSPADDTIHCILMTVEGLVLLEAHYDGEVHVLRMVPPLDRPGMAEGMIQDLRLTFFAPEAPARRTGLADDGDRVCRYALRGGGIQDIRLDTDGHWTIRRYDQRQRLIRTVSCAADAPLHPTGFPPRIVLEAHGLLGYRLTMTLLEAQRLTSDD